MNRTLSQVMTPSPTPDTASPDEIRELTMSNGLLPPRVESFENQLTRCRLQLDSKSSDIEKYLHLSRLRTSQTDTFYRLLTSNIQDYTPLIYTPTVGLACQQWSRIYLEREGLYLPVTAQGRVYDYLSNWTSKQVDICVVTDGSRVLGLGDLGIGGLGISIGKLSLYSAAAGIYPQRTLPIVVDFGTNNEKLLNDPLYLGLKQRRSDEDTQEAFMNEFMDAITRCFPKIIVQFEDFSSEKAFKWLSMYADRYACFNDDIQGTGAVILAGFIKAIKLSGVPAKDHRILFHGAGSAAVGVAQMIFNWIKKEANIDELQAKNCIWLGDSKGLVYDSRGDVLAEHKRYFSRKEIFSSDRVNSLEKMLNVIKPTCLIGLSTIGGEFTPRVLQEMAKLNEKPIIMALSNPVANSECTFEEAMVNSDGRVIFASGSPFPNFEYKGKTYTPGQGNNMYIFPGLGLGAILAKTSRVSDEMVFTASETLADCVTNEESEDGLIYPSLNRIREISKNIAANVIRTACEQGYGVNPTENDLEAYVQSKMYDPFYGSKL